ncbi:FAD-binding protein [Kribbella sp. NPDC051952]|uniref:FAD-binding protein n=1 Tax=Kribbella sp. NPDC051952 TaxID=3154851 RepID=UPI0034362E4B
MERTPPPLDGELRFDELTCAEHSDDFGHILRHVPEAVLLPGSADDVARAIRWAAQRGRKFAAQGARHATFGRSLVAGGIVADMSTLGSIGVVEDDRVVVGAGARWSDVLRATVAQGKTPPVLTEYLDLSVAGTLIVGGVGGTTSAYGVQSDNVLAMDVVTGEGTTLSCSATENVELFDMVRAGLGQVGVIVTATLKLVAAPESVRRFQLVYPDLATLLRDERLLSGDERFDAVQGAIAAAPGGGIAYRLDVVKYFDGDPPDDTVLLADLSDDPNQRQPTTLGYFDYANRFAALETALRANGQWFFPHPWLMTFVGDSRIESVVTAELQSMNPATDLGPFGQLTISPIRRSAISSPLLRIPSDDLCYAFNFVRMPATSDAEEVQRLVAANRTAYGRIKAAGGTLYPVSAFPLSQHEWRDHFGPAFDQLDAAKRQYDPYAILNPGYDLFEQLRPQPAVG